MEKQTKWRESAARRISQYCVRAEKVNGGRRAEVEKRKGWRGRTATAEAPGGARKRKAGLAAGAKGLCSVRNP